MWNSPYINHFLSADTIVPGTFNPQILNRFSYVGNNPIRFTDPSGHRCVPADECDTPHGDLAFVPSGRPPLLKFSTDEGQEFTAKEKEVFNAGAWDIAKALARGLNASCDRVDRKMGVCSFFSPSEAFYGVFGGPTSVKRVADTADWWAMHRDKNADGLYEIWVYSSTSTQEILDHPNLIVHEIGHAFYWAADGFIEGSSLGERNGFHGPYYQWQFGHDSPDDLGTEIFADMFLGWVYGKWEHGELPSGLSIHGKYKSDYMDQYMPLMIYKAIGR